MAHFAKLNENNVVLEVNVVSNDVLKDENGVEREELGVQFLIDWSGGHPYWKQTSYNNSFRKQYAGIGYTYDPINDVFLSNKPHPNAVLDENFEWVAPIPKPAFNINEYKDVYFEWDENQWILIPVPPDNPDPERYTWEWNYISREYEYKRFNA